MKVYRYPDFSSWAALLERPQLDHRQLNSMVQEVLSTVRQQGDAALKQYTLKFDGIELSSFRVTDAELISANESISDELKIAIQQAAINIRKFHEAQVQDPVIIETMPGVNCWRKSVGIEKVGLYIPGGTAPLFSTLLMLGIPATIAGCKEIILCSPPGRDGLLHPAILYAAGLVGITSIFKIGGVQAIAAMAFGTESVPKVFKIFGPGNQYVTCAKQLVQQNGIAIDMPAGPSEVAVFADATAHPHFVAADLLSQAEHGPDSQVLLVTTDDQMIEKVESAINEQLLALPRKDIALKALENSKFILVVNESIAMQLLNRYAAEHLILCTANAETLAAEVINAGSVFIGNYSPESVGDYASGTNHTLPTNGFATAFSGVSVDSFVKKISFQQLTPRGLQNISSTVVTMAEAEGLQAHANAVRIRMEEISKQ
jgi:histidinol dehydrogenase